AGKVEPVMPGEIVTKVAARDAGGVEPGAQSGERAPRALEPRGVAQDADVVPHHIVQRLAHRLDIARGTPDRMAHARPPLRPAGPPTGWPPRACAPSSAPAAGSRQAPEASVHAAIESPAMPPNTVEL